jgi:glycosyltransferase involved in cell wall biosynthesis
MRVLIVTTRYFPDLGGIETHVYETMRRLPRIANMEFTILTTDITGRLPPRESVNGVEVIRVPAWPKGNDLYFSPEIYRTVNQPRRWDLVHCQGIHNFVPVLAMLAARRAGIPYMVTFHTGGHSKRLRNALRPVQWRAVGPLLRGASALVAVSRFEAGMMSARARVPRDSITVIRNGGTLPDPPPGTAVVPGRIVSSGRLERYKGHHRVIDALPGVIDAIGAAHLVILGSGPYEDELLARAAGLGLSDRVSIVSVPPADRKAMAHALSQAAVVAALSDYEAHPVAVMEALSIGRPVVGRNIAGIGDLVDEGWVIGVDPSAPTPVVSRRLAEAMTEPNPVVPGEFPTWDTCAAQLAGVYQAVKKSSFT